MKDTYDLKNVNIVEQEIFELVLQILEHITGVNTSEITMDTNLVGDLDLNSLEILTVLAEVEDYYNIIVPEKEYKSIVTVGDYVHAILELQNEK